MLGLGVTELLVIFGIVLLIFGPKRLPELGNTMGKAIRNFKDAISGVEEAKFRKIEEERQAAEHAHNTAQADQADTTDSTKKDSSHS